jgi:lauroyl/myristoyl acyltransferase/mitochondrial fission protein ELM1
VFDILAVTLLRAGSALFARLPLKAALALGVLLARCVFFVRWPKGIAYLNLKAAFPELSSREIKGIARRSFENLGRTVAETLRIPAMDESYLSRYTRMMNQDRVDEAVRTGKGLIFLTPHFGNWELLILCTNRYVGRPLKILFREQKLKRVNEYLNRLRSSKGAELIGRKSAIREFIRALEQKAAIGMIADQAAKSGSLVEFFGRKTPAASGFAEVARRTGALIFPVFDVREQGDRHSIHVLPAIDPAAEESAPSALQRYYRVLESFIRDHPDQWLWDHKRWKYSFTKNVLVLADGKAGHESQSRSVAEAFRQIEAESPEYRFRIRTVPVEYRSRWRRRLLAAVTFLLLPWIRGRMGVLRFFLTARSCDSLRGVSADFVVSCGSSLIPVHLLAARENNAKKILLMKPSFPFHRARFDLIIASRHDAPIRGRVVYTEIAPNALDPGKLSVFGRELAERIGAGAGKKASLFIGGDTRDYAITPRSVEEALDRILGTVRSTGSEILVTTSRRTSPAVERLVKRKFSGEKSCRLLVIANEANPQNVAQGMMGLSDTIFVTEDSVSMISEAAASGKKVVILKAGDGSLPAKLARFRDNLAEKHLAQVVSTEEIGADCFAGASANGRDAAAETQREIKTQLMELL